MDLPTADQRHHGISGLLHLQALLGDVGVIAGHLDEPVVAKEVRCMQKVDVHAVTLDPPQ